MSQPERTVVHFVRHGEVHNPGRILYARLDGYHLSDLGRTMADVMADHFAANDVMAVISSSLQRARETAGPIADRHGLPVRIDDRVIEAANAFEGRPTTLSTFLRPSGLRRMYNVTRPSWGEPYTAIAERMTSALNDARDLARGREAVVVSHQLPIWTLRNTVEGRRLWHDPRRRECSLASVTSFAFAGAELTSVSYAEPAGHLLARASTVAGA